MQYKKETCHCGNFILGIKNYKTAEEIIEQIHFELPGDNDLFSFEKVCKRTHLDIASVNSALYLSRKGNIIVKAGLSAGGAGFLRGHGAGDYF